MVPRKAVLVAMVYVVKGKGEGEKIELKRNVGLNAAIPVVQKAL